MARGEHSAGPARSRIPRCNAVAPKRDGRSRCGAGNLQLVLARTIPRCPRAPGSALKAETPKRTPAWGFYFGIRGRTSQPAPRRTVAAWRCRAIYCRHVRTCHLQADMGRNRRVIPADPLQASGEHARPLQRLSHQLSRDEAFLIAVNITKLPSVPRQILKDIPRPPNSASRDD
jgi:hypothetical protein